MSIDTEELERRLDLARRAVDGVKVLLVQEALALEIGIAKDKTDDLWMVAFHVARNTAELKAFEALAGDGSDAGWLAIAQRWLEFRKADAEPVQQEGFRP